MPLSAVPYDPGKREVYNSGKVVKRQIFFILCLLKGRCNTLKYCLRRGLLQVCDLHSIFWQAYFFKVALPFHSLLHRFHNMFYQHQCNPILTQTWQETGRVVNNLISWSLYLGLLPNIPLLSCMLIYFSSSYQYEVTKSWA